MSENDLIIRRIRSRRLQRVVPIDYVAPAAPPAEQPQSAYTPVVTPKFLQVGKFLQQYHLAVFEETPPAFFTGNALAFYPAVTALRRRETKRRFQDIPLLVIADAITPTTAAVYPSFVKTEALKSRQTKRRFLEPEGLSFYAPTVFADVPYPAWVPPETYRWNVKVVFQALAELNVYPETAPASIMDRLQIYSDDTGIQLKSESTNITFHSDDIKVTFK